MKVMVLGSGQDGGVPQVGCACPNCQLARSDPSMRRLSPSIAVFDAAAGYCFIIDASPDFRVQVDMLPPDIIAMQRQARLPLTGILLTHAHYGHCAGLWELGREVVDERALPVYCTEAMEEFLRDEHPFSNLVEWENIAPDALEPDEVTDIDGLICEPFLVPHRDEAADTVGYVLGEERTLLYIPDIDMWTDGILEKVREADVALIDGTFFSPNELPRMESVPHPPMVKTIEALPWHKGRVFFTHLNHTNPATRPGIERDMVERGGFGVAFDGMLLEL